MGRIRARWLITLTVALALVAALIPAFLVVRSALASGVSIALSPTSGVVGATVRVSGTGYKRKEGVTITFDSATVASGATDNNGAFSASFVVPWSASVGSHMVEATGVKSHLTASATFQVTPVVNPGDWPQFSYGPQGGRDNIVETTLSASNAAQLTQDWSVNARGNVASVAVVSGVVYADDGMGVLAINAATGAQLWANSTMGGGGTESSGQAPAVANGIVYANGGDNQVYAFNAQTGATLWTYNPHSGLDSLPTVANGIVYIAADNGVISALNATTGALVWSYLASANYELRQTPAVANGAVYFVTQDGVAYALDATTGVPLWVASIGIYGPESAPAYDNGVVYMLAATDGSPSQGEIIAMDAATGATKWIALTPSIDMEGVTLADGNIYVSIVGSSYGVYAFDEATGAFKWNDPLAIGNSTPAAANGVVYVGAGTSYAYALDATTGATLATLGSCGIQPYTSPVVAAGVVYTGCATSLVAYHLPGATP